LESEIYTNTLQQVFYYSTDHVNSWNVYNKLSNKLSLLLLLTTRL